MFGIEALDVVIGMIFIYLLFSLFVSIVNELISTLFSMRGSTLYSALSQFLSETDLQSVCKDPRIQLLLKKKTTPGSSEPITKYNFPDFIPEEQIAEILYDNRNKLQNLSKTQLKLSKKKLLSLYDLTVSQAQRTYKKNIRIVILILSVVVSIGFNLDSISVYKELSSDTVKAATIANSAAQYIALNDSLDFSASDSATVKKIMLEIKNLNDQQLEKLDGNLGSIGWDLKKDEVVLSSIFQTISHPRKNSVQIIGWLISALALSLGAPFWFDLLKKLVNIKNEITKNTK